MRITGLTTWTIALVGALFMTTVIMSSPSHAAGETYKLSNNKQTLTITGGNVKALGLGKLELSKTDKVPPPSVDYGINNFSTDKCPTGSAWLSIIVQDNKTVAPESACGSRGNGSSSDMGDYKKYAQSWSEGSTIKTSKPPKPTKPSDASKKETYNFIVPPDDGKKIKACKGMFAYFSGGCLTFSQLDDESNLHTDGNSAIRYKVTGTTKQGCKATYTLGIAEDRALDGKVIPGTIGLVSDPKGKCKTGFDYKNFDYTLETLRGVQIGNADKLKSINGLAVENETKAKSDCQIDGIGWILCPVINTMALMVDGAYAFVSSLLAVQPLVTSADDGVYSAWKIMRNFANVAFVIAFMVIIFSQLTSIGMNNYGIKKLLPRIIIAAILVNVSYWICAIAVDLSNILGSSVNGLFQGLKAGLPDENTNAFEAASATGKGWVGIAGGVLAVTAIASISLLYVTLAALLPALVAALIAIVTVFIVLTLRQALIILLIVIAPLAFVAFLLPNTESLFKKWKGLFQTLLLMYPIIALIFGASALASTIVMKSASGDYIVAIQIMGAMISIVPLALTPVVMKTAGGLLNRFGGFVNNPNKGPFDRLKKGAENVKESRQNLARSRRLNGEGSNEFTKSWRRKAAIPTRIGNNLAARRDKNKASEEAAQAGYQLNNKQAVEAGQLRMAASAANSARQAESLKGLTSDAQRDAVGATSGENHALDAAIRGQIQSGEKQAISEVEAQLGPQSANQLANALSDAIRDGDTIKAQAAQNVLGGMGNKGADAIADTISAREREAAAGGKNENWDVMRTELARNMDAGVMSRNESLKNWSTRTELGPKDKLKEDKSLDSFRADVMKPGGEGMSVAKYSGQTPKEQLEMIKSGAATPKMMQASLSDQNVDKFDGSVVKAMEEKLVKLNSQASAAPGASSSGASSPGPSATGQASASPSSAQPGPVSSPNTPPPTSTQAAPAASSTSAANRTNPVDGSTLTIKHDQPAVAPIVVPPPEVKVNVNPVQGRTSPPQGTQNYKQTSGGLFVPPDTPTGRRSSNSPVDRRGDSDRGR